jgi:8-oxo-dGTP pyrophosphatase MutT (NUDIX family)
VIKAAGILFLTAADEVLLLKRGASGDHQEEWCFPGGTTEDGETAEQTAVRESEEEIGRCPDGERAVLTRRIADDVDFTTFLQRVPETFTPTLNDEHTGWAWVNKDAPSEPLHPGARVAIERLTMNELDIARAMARGDLVSPQRYENLWLFAIRITSTGMAYRKSLNEYVWRDPDLYMTQDFLDRCAGLSVIWEHPKKATLNSQEFADRIIGSIMLPYFQDQEIWGVAKIYDDEAAKELRDGQLSTSPAVVFRDPKVNSKQKLEDGSTLLIEGKPSLLDHIAICAQGVWDKAGPPTGVLNDELSLERADSMTTEEEKAAADKAKADAEAKVKAGADNGEKLNKMLSFLDSISSRMDAMEESDKERKAADKARKDEEEMADRKADAARFDAAKDEFGKKYPDAAKRFDAEEEDEKKKHEGETEEVAADRARKDRAVKMDKHRKDAEEEEAKKKADEARGDAARADSVKMIEDLQRKYDALIAEKKPLSDDEVDALAAAQARADTVYLALGKRASRPMSGETLHAYNIRLTREVQKHSPKWGKTELNRLPADTLATIQADVYADAVVAARNPDDVEPGTLREIKTPDSSGRIISTFVGKGTFIGAMKMPSRRVTAINTDHRR